MNFETCRVLHFLSLKFTILYPLLWTYHGLNYRMQGQCKCIGSFGLFAPSYPFFFIGWRAKQAPLCPPPPPTTPPRFGWSCNEDLKHQTLGCFDLYPAFINKCHRLFSFSFSFSLSSVSSSSSPALLSKSHIQYVSHHLDTKVKLWFHSNLGTFFFIFVC